MYDWYAMASPYGDVNHDGTITSTDAAIVLGMAVCGKYSTDADVSGDGRGTSLDALMILQAMTGSINQDRLN
ncbi:MAG: hypothetical protein EF812_06275 [Methanosarcinales archaeon]|nr:MAG: hypothetical protein EF812_06275 [Methanosarcinales archaeon]